MCTYTPVTLVADCCYAFHGILAASLSITVRDMQLLWIIENDSLLSKRDLYN